tara:strand:- start:171 stop:461 length:291 start_codon:yes stop_codon:yes gene_type:complete
MCDFKVGDLVEYAHPNMENALKVGLVVKDTKSNFMVKWLWYDKLFFMEKEGDIFKELNKTFVLNTETYLQKGHTPLLRLLNSIYSDGKFNKNGETS